MTNLLLNEDTIGTGYAFPFKENGGAEPLRSALPLAIQQRHNAGSVFLYLVNTQAVVGATAPMIPESVTPRWIRLGAAQCVAKVIHRHGSVAHERVRIQELKRYLDMCARRRFITASVGEAAWGIWGKINALMRDNLEVPDACPGPNGEILLTWDRGNDHFELEIEHDFTTTFFYLNTKLKTSWELTTNPHEPIDERVKNILEVFRRKDAKIPAAPWETSPRTRHRPKDAQ